MVFLFFHIYTGLLSFIRIPTLCTWVSQTYILFWLYQLSIAALQTTTKFSGLKQHFVISPDSLGWLGFAEHFFCSRSYGLRSLWQLHSVASSAGLEYLRWPLFHQSLSPSSLSSFRSLAQASLQHGSQLPGGSVPREQVPMWKCLSCPCLPMPVNIKLS